MIVRSVIGPWLDPDVFRGACPVLGSYSAGLHCYVGDPHSHFGPAVRVGKYKGFDNVFESYGVEGWFIVFIGGQIKCDMLRVEEMIVMGPRADQTEFYYLLRSCYATRIDATHYCPVDHTFS